MKFRITLVTLGVSDLKKSMEFYRGLGLETDGIVGESDEEGGVVFFDLGKGLRLALWERTSIAKDTGLKKGGESATEFTLAFNLSSSEEVDEAMEMAKKAGANIIKPADKTFWGGYAGYFQDPDGHVWEVAWNPYWKFEE